MNNEKSNSKISSVKSSDTSREGSSETSLNVDDKSKEISSAPDQGMGAEFTNWDASDEEASKTLPLDESLSNSLSNSLSSSLNGTPEELMKSSFLAAAVAKAVADAAVIKASVSGTAASETAASETTTSETAAAENNLDVTEFHDITFRGQTLSVKMTGPADQNRSIVEIVQSRLASAESKGLESRLPAHFVAIHGLFELAQEYVHAKKRLEDYQKEIKDCLPTNES